MCMPSSTPTCFSLGFFSAVQAKCLEYICFIELFVFRYVFVYRYFHRQTCLHKNALALFYLQYIFSVRNFCFGVSSAYFFVILILSFFCHIAPNSLVCETWSTQELFIIRSGEVTVLVSKDRWACSFFSAPHGVGTVGTATLDLKWVGVWCALGERLERIPCRSLNALARGAREAFQVQEIMSCSDQYWNPQLPWDMFSAAEGRHRSH